MKRPNGPGQGMVAAAVDSPTSAKAPGPRCACGHRAGAHRTPRSRRRRWLHGWARLAGSGVEHLQRFRSMGTRGNEMRWAGIFSGGAPIAVGVW